MGKLSPDPKNSLHFRCGCGHAFEAAPSRTEDAPDRPWHPYRYFTGCPDCGQDSEQAFWEINLLKAYSRSTGPTSKDGIEAVTKNIEGHPTPQETQLTRFNALKHGMRSEVATFFPARPGHYPQCATCDLIETCETGPACMKKTELYMKHHIAYETGDPSILAGLRATLQANIQAVIDDMFLAIIQDGVRLKTPQWYYDKDGDFHWAKGIDPTDPTGKSQIVLYEIQAHPLIKLVGELISKNGMTLSDSSMTVRQAGDGDGATQETDKVSNDELRDWKKESDRQTNQLMGMIKRSQNVIDVTPTPDHG